MNLMVDEEDETIMLDNASALSLMVMW